MEKKKRLFAAGLPNYPGWLGQRALPRQGGLPKLDSNPVQRAEKPADIDRAQAQPVPRKMPLHDHQRIRKLEPSLQQRLGQIGPVITRQDHARFDSGFELPEILLDAIQVTTKDAPALAAEPPGYASVATPLTRQEGVVLFSKEALHGPVSLYGEPAQSSEVDVADSWERYEVPVKQGQNTGHASCNQYPAND
jgi:hypothetical protein